MEMDMQEPGEMCCLHGEAHNLALTYKWLEEITGWNAIVHRIIISCLNIAPSRLCASLLHFSGFIVIDRLKSIGGLKSSEKIFNAAVAKAKLMKILE